MYAKSNAGVSVVEKLKEVSGTVWVCLKGIKLGEHIKRGTKTK